MRNSLYLLLTAGLFLILLASCSGSSSPTTPGTSQNQDSHQAAIDLALNGVEIQNNDLVSVKLDSREILPWGFRDILLAPEGTYPLEISLRDNSREIFLSVDGATLKQNGREINSYTGPASASLSVSDLSEQIHIHLETTGENSQAKDIIIRTTATPHLPIPPSPGIESYIDNETGLTIDITKGELLVGVQIGTPIDVVEALTNALGCELLRAIPDLDIYRLRIPSGASYEHYISLYEQSAIVKYAELNCIRYPAIIPNDTYQNQEYENYVADMHEAWDIHQGTNSTLACVIDTGAMRDHPDLAANIVNGEDFISPIGDGLGGETPGDGVDNNGDGVTDGNVGHGSHCSGIIGAVGNNNEGVSGLSWHTRIMPLRVFPVDGDSGAEDSAITEAINYAGNQGATVISMSLGGFYSSQSQQTAINSAWSKGCVIVAAAGNSNVSNVFYPAGYNNVIAVAATDSNDKKASFSNYGSYVDVSAPGVQVPSSIFYTYSGSPYNVPENQRYALYSGTSMACPQVAGLVALVGSYFPSYTNAELADQVIFTADNIDGINPSYAGRLGTGRINGYNALTKPLAPDFEILKMSQDDDNPLYSMGNRDGFLNPGEIIEFQPTLRNSGSRNAPNCVMNLESDNGDLEILFGSISLGTVNVNATITPSNPLIFRINPSITNDKEVELKMVFEYTDGDPIEVDYPLMVRTDKGIVDIIAFSGEGLLHNQIAKGAGDIPALMFTMEGNLNYGTLEKINIHQTGTAPGSSFSKLELWLDANHDGVFSSAFDTRVAYRSYNHPGYRGSFDDLNDPAAGFTTGINYVDFAPTIFDKNGLAVFHDIVVPTAPGVPRNIFVVIGIDPDAPTGDTVQLGILSANDVIVKAPDQVSPINFPIQTDEVPIRGTWLNPDRLTHTPTAADARYSWRAETAVCPITGYVYVVFDSNRNTNFDVFIMRSTDYGATFGNAVKLDSSTANEFYPDIQVDSSGVLHVVYYSTKISNDNREIYYTRSINHGVTWETPVRLTNAIRDGRTPKLAIGPDQSLNIAWHDNRASQYNYDIYFKRSTDGGNNWGSDVLVAGTATSSEEVAIAVGGDGVIHLSWQEMISGYQGNVWYSRSTNNGAAWSSPFKITSDAYNNRGWHSDVGADNNGNVYVVFHYLPSNSSAEISMRKSTNSGANWASLFNITSNSIPDSRPGIFVSPSGDPVDLVFRRLEAEVWNIWHTYSSDGFQTWEVPVQISLSVGGGSREAVVVRASNLNIYAFWEEIVNSQGNYEIFWNRYLH